MSFDIINSVPTELNIWGYSSAGRALEWHSRGQRFDPAYLHHTLVKHNSTNPNLMPVGEGFGFVVFFEYPNFNAKF